MKGAARLKTLTGEKLRRYLRTKAGSHRAKKLLRDATKNQYFLGSRVIAPVDSPRRPV